MHPIKVLHIIRVGHGGALSVMDKIVRNLDKNKYTPVVFFDTNQKSFLRENLIKVGVENVLSAYRKQETSKQKVLKYNRGNVKKEIEKKIGEKAGKLYIILKRVYEFTRFQSVRINTFKKIIKDYNIKIVHTHSELIHGKAEILAAHFSDTPCITHCHGNPGFTKFDMLFERFVDRNIYISTYIERQHIEKGASKDKGIVIHNGIDIKDYKKEHDDISLRKEFGEKKVLVGIIGRISWWKGHEYFINAIAKLNRLNSGVKGIIIGGITDDALGRNKIYYKNLLALVENLALTEKIYFAGHRNNIPSIISALDIVVHATSSAEPFGMVVIEGMAGKKPVIATKAGGVIDIIEDRKNGLLVPCKDSEAIAKAIYELITKKTFASKLAYSGQKCVERKFSLNMQVNRIQAVYEEVIKK